MVILLVSFISLLARHFIQYACILATSFFRGDSKLFVPTMSIAINTKLETKAVFGSGHSNLLYLLRNKNRAMDLNHGPFVILSIAK